MTQREYELTVEIESSVVPDAGEPGPAGHDGLPPAVIVWSREIDRVLWSSPEAERLLPRFAVADGRVDPEMPARARLRELADGAAPRGEGAAVERIPIGPEPTDVATLACRIVQAGGGDALLTVVLSGGDEAPAAATPEAVSTAADEVPAPDDERVGPTEEAPAPETAAAANEPEPPGGAVESDEAARLDALRAGGMRRFIWSADSGERFLSVSAPLGEVVGPENADIVGRRWQEVEGRLVHDGEGVVARAFADRATWSNQTVLWRIAETSFVVPVDLGGMPVFGKAHELEGFRGFGLCRTGEITPDPIPPVDPDGRADPPPAAGLPPPVREAAGPLPDIETAPAEPATETALAEPAAEAGAAAEQPAREEQDTMMGAGTVAAAAETSFGALQVRIGAQLGGGRPVPLRAGPEPAAETSPDRPILSTAERGALREIARALGARLDADEAPEAADGRGSAEVVPMPTRPRRDGDPARVLDRLPAGILVLRGETPLYSNRFLLDLLGYADLADLGATGSVSRLFGGRPRPGSRGGDAGAHLSLVTRSGSRVAVEARLTTVEWGDHPASLMLVRPIAADPGPAGRRSLQLEIAGRDARVAELDEALDLAGVAVATVDGTGRILSLTRAGERLFGVSQNEVAGEAVTTLLAPESHRGALDVLDRARPGQGAGPAGEPFAREVLSRSGPGGTVPLLMRAGQIGGADGETIAAVFTDISPFKRTEAELNAARRAAESASIKQSEFLARVSHEIRTPLNAIIGFAEIMREERFGTIGNERYRLYLKDIGDSGNHVVSLVNDLLDIAKIASGKSDLSFVSLDLNDVVAGSIGIMQPSASRDRIVVRTGFAHGLPRVVADERSVRQIALNLVGNAIRFTEAGGQVIVSTNVTDRGEVALRVRDTGIGMSPEEVGAAMEPFRQVSVSRRGGGTGLGLPLSKALVEANHGIFTITSRKGDGTLIEVLFPPSRVLAD